MSAVGTTQPYPANSLAGRLAGWLGLVGQGRLAGVGRLGGAKQKPKNKSPSAVGTVQIFKLFLTF